MRLLIPSIWELGISSRLKAVAKAATAPYIPQSSLAPVPCCQWPPAQRLSVTVWLLPPGPPALLHPALPCLVQEHCASVPRSWRWRGGGGGGCGIWAKLWRDVRICHTTNDQERVGRLWTGKSDFQFDSVGEDAEFLSVFEKIFHLFFLPLRINQQIFRCLLVSVWKTTFMPFRWWEFVRFWLSTISTLGISGKTLNLTL